MSTLAESPPTRTRAWRIPVIIAATLILAATGFMFAQQRAEAVTIVQGTWYQLVNVNSNKLMEVAGGSTADGTMVQQYDNSGCQCQHFRFESAGTGWWRIVARHSGKAVDLWGWSTADGAEYRQWPITSGFNQQFSVQDINGNAQFINRHSGKALEVWEWSTANGGRVSQFADTNGANQQWRLVAVGGGTAPPPPPPPPPPRHRPPGSSAGPRRTAAPPAAVARRPPP